MNWDPNLVYYACIAKGTTILAEFNSKDAELADLAAKCLEKTPPLHATFSHTVRGRTYTFLIDDPFTYFGIFDEKLDNAEALSFLHDVKNSFDHVVGNKRSDSGFNSHCFQGEFNPVFHQLLSTNSGFEIPHSPPRVASDGGSLRSQKSGSVPLLTPSTSLKKKKKRLFGEGNGDNNKVVNVMADGDASLMVHHKHGGNETPKARRLWKKQVLVVLSLDLMVCCALFGIWLWVCSGFRCIAG